MKQTQFSAFFRALCPFGGRGQAAQPGIEDKREFMTETHDHFGRTASDLTAQLTQANFRLPAGMTTIEIETLGDAIWTSQLRYRGHSKSCNRRALGRGRA